VKPAYIKQYRDFWDVPRIFLVVFDQSFFLFDCMFDPELEDFDDEYQVFVMPELGDADLAGSWKQLSEKSIRTLGKIKVSDVNFDETRRSFIDASAISQLLETTEG